MGIHQTTDPNGCLLDDVQAEKHRITLLFSYNRWTFHDYESHVLVPCITTHDHMFRITLETTVLDK